jgi:hypothetical protein
MIELLLKLIDRIIDLKKYETERIEKTFREVLDPLFGDLMNVHRDYLSMFIDVQRQLEVQDVGIAEDRQRLHAAAETLRVNRLQFEPVRQKLTALSRELANRKGLKLGPPEADEFVRSVIEYFPQGDLGDGLSRSSALVVVLRSVAAIDADQLSRHAKGMPALVAATIRNCSEKWVQVCERHASLKAAVLAAQ